MGCKCSKVTPTSKQPKKKEQRDSLPLLTTHIIPGFTFFDIQSERRSHSSSKRENTKELFSSSRSPVRLNRDFSKGHQREDVANDSKTKKKIVDKLKMRQSKPVKPEEIQKGGASALQNKQYPLKMFISKKNHIQRKDPLSLKKDSLPNIGVVEIQPKQLISARHPRIRSIISRKSAFSHGSQQSIQSGSRPETIREKESVDSKREEDGGKTQRRRDPAFIGSFQSLIKKSTPKIGKEENFQDRINNLMKDTNHTDNKMLQVPYPGGQPGDLQQQGRDLSWLQGFKQRNLSTPVINLYGNRPPLINQNNLVANQLHENKSSFFRRQNGNSIHVISREDDYDSSLSGSERTLMDAFSSSVDEEPPRHVQTDNQAKPKERTGRLQEISNQIFREALSVHNTELSHSVAKSHNLEFSSKVRIGNYEILGGRIGAGAYAVVKKAKRMNSNKIYVNPRANSGGQNH